MLKSNAQKPINWVAVRAEYEAGGVTLQQLADRLGVSLRTVLRRSSKESWAKGVIEVSQQVSQQVSQKVRDNIVTQRVGEAMSNLDIAKKVIQICFANILANPDNFRTTGETIAAMDRMFKFILESSDEHVEKWLYDKGYVAVPISELTPSSKASDHQGESTPEAQSSDN